MVAQGVLGKDNGGDARQAGWEGTWVWSGGPDEGRIEESLGPLTEEVDPGPP